MVSEETRLNKGLGVFEFERVKSLIEKYIKIPSSIILDIGGGTGKYSEWLAKKGHQVHLVEPVPKHLKIASERNHRNKIKFTIHSGESQNLIFKNNYADIVILHGPLYHLQNHIDRDKTIKEAIRVLKPNGIILAFAINYTASTMVGLLNGLIHKKTFFKMCKEELTTGIHNPPDDFPWLLSEAFYHNPKKLKEEFLNQDITYLNTHAVEGITWLDKNIFVNLENSERKETLLKLIEITETDPQLLSLSPHIMIATQKNFKK